jgi:predicted DNA binding protein
MRYAKTVYEPPDGRSFDAIGEALADADGVTREYIHRTERAPDDTVVTLLSVRGDDAVAEAVLRAEPSVLDVAVTNPDGGAALAYVRHEASDVVEAMLRARETTAVVVSEPVVVHDSGALEITYLGTDEAFVDALDNVTDVSLEVLETGRYTPERRDVFDSLTPRQAEVVDAAVRLGYYENPREATQGAVADAIGCSPGVAGEHLRKAEARVFSQFVD